MTGVFVDYQVLFNVAMGALMLLVGWVLKVVWDALRDLKQADDKLADRVAEVHVLVAGRYITREEFSTTCSTLFSKLDRIAEKLDGKQDR